MHFGMSLSKKEIEEKLDQGEIQCIITLQVVGKPKEHVEDSMEKYLDLVDKEKAITVINIEEGDAEELEEEDGFFSAFAEIEMLVPGVDALTQIAFNLSPANIEILEPQEFEFAGRHLQLWLNDLLTRIHEVGTGLRGERQRAAHFSKALLQISKNFISVLLASGAKDEAALARMTGLEGQPLQRALEKMQEDGTISKDGEKWTLKSQGK